MYQKSNINKYIEQCEEEKKYTFINNVLCNCAHNLQHDLCYYILAEAIMILNSNIYIYDQSTH